VYDRSLSLDSALKNNLTSLVGISALGSSSVDLDIRERVLFNHSKFGKYRMGITFIPSPKLVCDTANNTRPERACVASINLRAPNFLKTTEIEKNDLTWTVRFTYRHGKPR
jgi:hypothetical protein